MKIWKVILATLVIFVAGVLTGAVISRLSDRPRHALFPFHAPGFNPSPTVSSNREPRLTMPFSRPPGRSLGKDFLARLERELKLDAGQRRRVEQILEESQKRNKVIWEQIAPELREEMKRSREQIREVLTPEQQKRMDELMKHPSKATRDGQPATAAPPPPPQDAPAPPPADSPEPPPGGSPAPAPPRQP